MKTTVGTTGLILNEPLLWEKSVKGRTGYSLPTRDVAEAPIDGVIHFAAESHVDRSIEGPADFIQTNILGTFTLLEAARKHWLNGEKGSVTRQRHSDDDSIREILCLISETEFPRKKSSKPIYTPTITGNYHIHSLHPPSRIRHTFMQRMKMEIPILRHGFL